MDSRYFTCTREMYTVNIKEMEREAEDERERERERVREREKGRKLERENWKGVRIICSLTRRLH